MRRADTIYTCIAVIMVIAGIASATAATGRKGTFGASEEGSARNRHHI